MLKVNDGPVHGAVKDVVLAIRQARELEGISKYRLAKLTGLHPSTIGLIEHGERNPSLFVVLKMAEALEISLAEILNDCESSMHDQSPQEGEVG